MSKIDRAVHGSPSDGGCKAVFSEIELINNNYSNIRKAIQLFSGNGSETGLESIVKASKSRKHNFYFALICLAYILVYCIKAEGDVFCFRRNIQHHHQTFTEQPLAGNASRFFKISSGFPSFSESADAENDDIGCVPILRFILLAYNSRIHHPLTQQEILAPPARKNIVILHKQNAARKSSENEDPYYRIYAQAVG